jgi:hypothetical protein
MFAASSKMTPFEAHRGIYITLTTDNAEPLVALAVVLQAELEKMG